MPVLPDLVMITLAHAREAWLALTCQSPLYESIRSDSRFAKIVKEIGLPPYRSPNPIQAPTTHVVVFLVCGYAEFE
jgi:hypothetical protein